MQPIVWKDFRLEFGKKTYVMGIINVTPDSFSDGGQFLDLDAAVHHAEEIARDGADILDIGGESTRPGAEPVAVEEEIHRVVPVIQRVSRVINLPISVDTYKAEVARAALDAGAWMVNDISGFTMDPGMMPLVAESGCPAAIMHIRGTPRDMQQNPVYEDVVTEIIAWLRERIAGADKAGISPERLIVDPGIGFGKTVEHNLEILRKLREFKMLGRPLLVGTSRKSFIGKILGGLPPRERLEGTAATVAISIANGADIVRVHDVKEMVRVVCVADAVLRG